MTERKQTTKRKKVAVVTGANRGLGLEACRQLGALGYRVILAEVAGEAEVTEV